MIVKELKKHIERYSDPEERVKLFYEPGVDGRCDQYAEILNDGDFEKWMPFCYIDKSSMEFKKAKQEADVLKVEGSPKNKCRVLWIKSRFEVYCSREWKYLLQRKGELLKQVR